MKHLILLLSVLFCTSLCSAQGVLKKPSKPPVTKQKTSKPKPTVSVSQPDAYVDGHGYVDLGLPSGTKWATCNLGATSPSGFGDYYAWGESDQIPYGAKASELQSAGVINSSGRLQPSSDKARIEWGSRWGMPTREECVELMEKCDWTMMTYKGHRGYLVKGPNSKTIFFPFSGWKMSPESGSELYDVGDEGNYLSCDLGKDYDDCIYSMCLMVWVPNKCIDQRQRTGSRFPIRPVLR